MATLPSDSDIKPDLLRKESTFTDPDITLIKLRNINLLGGVIKWIHYDFDVEFIYFVEKGLDLLLILIILMKYQESST